MMRMSSSRARKRKPATLPCKLGGGMMTLRTTDGRARWLLNMILTPALQSACLRHPHEYSL